MWKPLKSGIKVAHVTESDGLKYLKFYSSFLKTFYSVNCHCSALWRERNVFNLSTGTIYIYTFFFHSQVFI